MAGTTNKGDLPPPIGAPRADDTGFAADYDQGGRERHSDPAARPASFAGRDHHPDVPDFDAPVPADGDETASRDPAYGETVGYLDRGYTPPAEGSDPAADDRKAGPYSGLEGTGPQPDAGRAGQTNTSGLPTALARPRPRT